MKRTKPIEPSFMVYTGPSMNPTLRAGDKLQVIPYERRKIRPGDVVVFISPGDGSKITHRVISVDSQGIRTRGDNSSQVDPWVLSPDDILGRVAHAHRGNRRGRVFGGSMGQVFGTAVRALLMVDSSISSLLHPAYHWLARKGAFKRWLYAQTKMRVISFRRHGGTEMQLLMNQRVIGRWTPGKAQWHIRRPFRLFVDERSLPNNPPKSEFHAATKHESSPLPRP